MRKAVLCGALFSAVVALVALTLPGSLVAGTCTKDSGCKDCGYFPSTQSFECATVKRDAYCSCSNTSDGCDLGTDTCDYTGSPQDCGATPAGECPDVPF